MFDERARLLQGLWLEPAALEAPISLTADNAGFLEHVEVFRDRSERDGKWCGKLTDGARSARQARDDATACPVRESMKHGVEAFVGSSCFGLA